MKKLVIIICMVVLLGASQTGYCDNCSLLGPGEPGGFSYFPSVPAGSVKFENWSTAYDIRENNDYFCAWMAIASVLMTNESPSKSQFEGYWEFPEPILSINHLWQFSDIKSSCGKTTTDTYVCAANDELERLFGAIRIAQSGRVRPAPYYVKDALVSKFGYSVDVYWRNVFPDSPLSVREREVLLESLIKGRLAIPSNSGHAWLIDGYRAATGDQPELFHIADYYSCFGWVSNPLRTRLGEATGVVYNIEPGFQKVMDQVGENDDFHGPDPFLPTQQSPRVREILDYIKLDPGQGPAVEMDSGGSNRAVGWTHNISLPPGALVTDAVIEIRVKGTDVLVYNDSIIYDESQLDPLNECAPPACNTKQYSPLIVLRDIVSHEPTAGEVMNLRINLGKVPVRIHTQLYPGAHWPPAPDEYRDLLGLLSTGKINLVIGDDTMVDYSKVTVVYVLPGALKGDLNGDGQINRNDLDMVMGVLGTKAYGTNDPRDLDHDGLITVRDARMLVTYCSKPRCAL